MGPYEYLLVRIDGDYALLQRTDRKDAEILPVARALLPPQAGEGDRLHYENFSYTIV
ncbi:MAG: chorismate--pyruvate lyase [Oscillospiraceae bacterium]|nr:chorismate--pyruvate lyase [Oscillospiraceae bacterium]